MAQKFIHIVRHGKALQEYKVIADIDRPLVEAGIYNSIVMANRFKTNYVLPELIISSPAARALHTAHIFARILKYPSKDVQVADALYMHGKNAALDILYGLSNNIHSVMLVAHNPDFTDLANEFIRPMIDSIPTSGIVTVCCETGKWEQIHQHVKDCTVDFPKHKALN